jgi:D-glycerate 3-kinase
MPNPLPQWQERFLSRHRLEPDYLHAAQIWFAPLARALREHQKGARRPLLVALNGCQGSGKSTVCDYLRALLTADYGVPVAVLSLDDFYLTRRERQALATAVHPLFYTRGVPGTHDLALLGLTLDGLLAERTAAPVAIPRFDKAADDRRPRTEWDEVAGGAELVLLEGWCLGAQPQGPAELAVPVNALEREEDPDGRWRRRVNAVLAQDFLPLYQRVDRWVMLRAPSFDCVYRWRLEQEQKLAASAGAAARRVMSTVQVARFIQFYQRLTQQCLETMPARVDHLFTLDGERRVTACRHGAQRMP